MTDNPSCPVCGAYNAMLSVSAPEGVRARCRDCGHEARAEAPPRTIRVLMLPVDGAAFETDLGSDLASLRRAVGGYLEAVTLTFVDFDPARRHEPRRRLVLICNEDGHRLGLAPNPHAPPVGPCFITRCNDATGEFEDLTADDWRFLAGMGFR